MKTLSVDIWSDVMCPWCAVGWTQFAKAIQDVGGEIEVTARFMPFELNPDLPPEGKDQQKHLAEVYRRSAEEVAAMRAQLHAAADRAGFPPFIASSAGLSCPVGRSMPVSRTALWRSVRLPTSRLTCPPAEPPWLGVGPSS